MRIFRNLEDARTAHLPRVVATLGVFDGVHRGHQRVLERLRDRALALGGTSVLVTFPSHPRALLVGAAPKLLMSLRQRLRMFADLGLDATLLLRFDQDLREWSAETFASRVFGEVLRSEEIVLGYDGRFGKGATGNVARLRQLGFVAEDVDELAIDGRPISSTRIRECVLSGDLAEAEHLLGRPFSLVGNVVPGDRIGRTLGFPTANLNLHHVVRPPRGVYGVTVRSRGVTRFGVVNIGVRPTVQPRASEPGLDWSDRDSRERVEVHILDFEGDLYGEFLEVIFLCHLRDERRFSGPAELAARIHADVLDFRTWLASNRPSMGAQPEPI